MDAPEVEELVVADDVDELFDTQGWVARRYGSSEGRDDRVWGGGILVACFDQLIVYVGGQDVP